MSDGINRMMSMYDSTVRDIRETYKNDEWFEDATDGDIVNAWGQRSEDSCASWLSYMIGERSESFENYLRQILNGKRIDMILFCPNCMHQHIDVKKGEWKNPPHKSHLCDTCGFIWRPADVPTNGVAEIKTKGEKDSSMSDIDILVFTSEELLQLLEEVRNNMAQMIEQVATSVFQLDFKSILKRTKK